MKLLNSTNINPEFIKAVYKIARPSSLKGTVSVRVINTDYPNGWGGAYYNCYNYGCDHHIVIAVPREKPHLPYYRGTRFSEITQEKREFSLIRVMAHELRHIWQPDHKTRLAGRKGRFSEKDADAYAETILKKWKEKRPSIPFLKPKKEKKKRDLIEERKNHAEKMLKRAERKLKIWTRQVKFWRKKVKYYQNKQ